MVNITDQQQVDEKPFHTIATVQAASEPLAQVHKRARSPNTGEDRRDTVSEPPEYAACRTRFTDIPRQFVDMWDTHFGQINTGTNTFNRSLPEDRPIHAAPYRTGRKAQETEKEEID